MVAIDVVKLIIRANPGLKRALRMAHIPRTPEQFVKRSVVLALYISVGLSALAFFLFARALGVKVVPVVFGVFAASMVFATVFIMSTPHGMIRKREKEIDREVLFAGRYLLVKMESGSPLFNSLIDASRSFSASSKYFKEVVDDINTGTPIESALENAREYNASEKFKKVIWQILTALKTGSDVTGALRSTLRTIAKEQMIEIKEYGKKLNSLMLFYMVIACILPSLGVALFIIFASFFDLSISTAHLFAALFGLFVVQLAFIIMIKAARPTIEL